MGRLLFFAAILFLGFLLFRWIKGVLANKPGKPPAASTDKIEDILPCAYCGTHIPRHSAVTSGEKHYCSRAHMEADR